MEGILFYLFFTAYFMGYVCCFGIMMVRCKKVGMALLSSFPSWIGVGVAIGAIMNALEDDKPE